MALNNIDPTVFTTSVLIGDTNQLTVPPIMTTVGNVPVSAALEIKSTQGMLLVPRLSSGQAILLPTVVDGMLGYVSSAGGPFTAAGFYGRVNGAWLSLDSGGNAPLDATYILRTPNATLINSQIISDLPLINNVLAIGNTAFAGVNPINPNFSAGINVANATMTGVSNVSLGINILNANVSGDGCVSVGVSNLTASTNISYVTSVGFETCKNLGALAIENTGLGAFALSGAVGASGNNNTAVGTGSMQNFTSASFCSTFGSNAGSSLTTGIHHTLLGYKSGFGLTTSNDVTSVGYEAGQSLTTGSSCTFLGAGSDVDVGTRTNACAIGHNAIVGADDAITLGNACTVGINESIPIAALHVANTGSGAGFPKADIFLAKTTNTPVTNAGGGFLYVNLATGALHYLSPAGTDTPIGPA